MSYIPILLFNDEQKINESLTDYVNRIAFQNCFDSSESMINAFLNIDEFKTAFVRLQGEMRRGESIPSFGLIGSNQGDLYRKRFSFKKRSFSWDDLKLFIELATTKRIKPNSFPRKDYSHSQFRLTNCKGSLKRKICLKCWENDSYIRFYWNFENYNYCHHHKCMMIDYDVEKALIVDDQPSRERSIFIENLFDWLDENHGQDLNFNFIEKEIFQFQQDFLLADFLDEFFNLVFSISLKFQAVDDLLRSCQLVNKSPDERIKIIVSKLSSGDKKIEDKIWCLFVYLYFIDSSDYVDDYQYCYFAKLFSFARSVNLTYYREYLWRIVFKSELFLGLVVFVRERHFRLFEIEYLKFNDELNIPVYNEVKRLNLDSQDIEFLFSLECFKFLAQSEIYLNVDELLEKSPKGEVRTDFFWFKPIPEETRLLEKVVVKVMERMVANIFIKMSRDEIYLPEKLYMRRY
ncbi:TniQ family protein [Thiomicrorhabdus sp. Kp2]|jgi:hypothetical protein|uniref:TniQ family protein n=1 Tax=Thiomicrorhabdus sp. Kp2 TaxID=1123518 RepID=UPI00041307E4|nr:TniQ family protein [Thiomicrorhabdus sp. Kp2]